jgi:putative resolvase
MNEQKEDGRMFISIREAVDITGLCNQTLRKLADQNKIKTYKTLSGQRKFDKRSLQEMCNTSVFVYKNEKNTKQNFIYTRVSSKKQLDDLSRQIEFIRTKNTEYNLYTIISDVGSGINFKRKGLSTILDSCMQQNIGNIVIAHRDRLSRFGFDLINIIVQKSGGKIIVIDD